MYVLKQRMSPSFAINELVFSTFTRALPFWIKIISNSLWLCKEHNMLALSSDDMHLYLKMGIFSSFWLMLAFDTIITLFHYIPKNKKVNKVQFRSRC